MDPSAPFPLLSWELLFRYIGSPLRALDVFLRNRHPAKLTAEHLLRLSTDLGTLGL